MPTFGYETQGLSNISIKDVRHGTVFTGVAGTLIFIHAALTAVTEGATSNKCAIYTYDGDLTNSLFGSTDPNVGSHSDGFQVFIMNPSVVTAVTTYVLAAWSNVDTDTEKGSDFDNRLKFDIDASFIGVNDAATYNGWDDPITWDSSDFNKYSIFACVTVPTGVGWYGPDGYF